MAYHVFLMVLLWDCIATGNTRLLRRGLETTHDIPHDVTWFTYIRCHDDIGLGYADDDIREAGYDPSLHRQFILEYYTGEYPGSTARGQRFMADPESGDARISGTAASLLGLEYAKEQGDEEELSRGIDRLTMLYGLVCSIGGIPILYYGDEVGYSNDYSYREEPGHRHDNRWMHRPRIDWQHMERRHEEGTAEARVFSRITNLVGVRKSLPELGADAGFALLHPPNEHLVAFLRYTPEARTLVVANVSGLPQYTDAALLSQAGITAPAHDAISGDRVQPVSRSLVLEPYRIYWLRETLRSPEHVLH
jgi:amylosucrase